MNNNEPENEMNYDPNLVLCGRMAKQKIKLVFGIWNYRSERTVEIGGNCTGLRVIESAVSIAFDELDGGDCASIRMIDNEGNTMLCEDEDGRCDNWLEDMLISAEIVSIEADEKEEQRGCKPRCGHTEAEHNAFDAGVTTGTQAGLGVANPYKDEQLREAWESGYSVGVQNWKETQP